MFTGVTVILPAFLRDAGEARVADLVRAAESVLSQESSVPVELLIVDDGSEPELTSIPELRELLARPQVRLLRLVQNHGLVYALNTGLTQAHYDLIARIDQDDLWRPGKLQKQLERMVSDPDLSLVATSMRLVHARNHSLDRDELRGGEWHEVLSFFANEGCPFPHGSILAHRDVFDLLGGYPHDTQFTHCEDYALWSSWVRFFKVAVLDEVLFEYTVSSDQVSSRYANEQRLATDLVRGTFLQLPDRQRIPEAVQTIADALQRTVLETSKTLCEAWMFYEDIVVPAGLYDAAVVLFPDRSVHRIEESGDLLVGRSFRLPG